MKFVLYGRFSPSTYINADTAKKYRNLDLKFIERDCDDVLVAFDSGREIGRTYDMSRLLDWVDAVAGKPPHHCYTGGYVQDPLPWSEHPPCR